MVDFGANLAGVVQLQGFKCPANANITLRHAEILQHTGLPDAPQPNPRRIYTQNLRGARATDVYVCAGLPEGEGTWAPHFTYHGFRYVEVAVSHPNVVLAAGQLRLLHQHSMVDPRASLWFPGQPILNRLQVTLFPFVRSCSFPRLPSCSGPFLPPCTALRRCLKSSAQCWPRWHPVQGSF